MDTAPGPAATAQNNGGPGTTSEQRVRQPGRKGDNYVDLVLEALGTHGPYQILQLSLQIFSSLAVALPILAVVFLGFKPDYRCNQLDNSTDIRLYLGPSDSSHSIILTEYSKCTIDVTLNHSGTVTSRSLPCVAGINFSMPHDTSFLTEWSLVCDKTGLTELSQTVVMAGMAVGALFFGSLSDRYGRRKVYVGSGLGLLLATSITSVAPNYYVLVAFRVATGALTQGISLSSYTMFLELLPAPWRCIASVLDGVLWAVGSVVMAIIAYLMQGVSWRYLNLAFSSLFLYTLVLPCCLDESLRWLASKGKVMEIERIARRACRMNSKDFQPVKEILDKIVLPSQQLDTDSKLEGPGTSPTHKDHGITHTIKDEANDVASGNDGHPIQDDREMKTSGDPACSRYSSLDLFRHRAVLVPLLVTTFVWLSNSFYYYGVMLGSSTLAGNRFLNFGILSILDIPSSILALFLMPRFNRKTLSTWYGMVSGLSLLASVAFAQLVGGNVGLTLANIASYLGKFSLTGSYCVLFVFGLEVFPTYIRTVGLGVASAVSRAAGMLAPFVVLLGETIPWAPGVLIGSLCILATLSIRLLPETRHRRLPDTVQEIQAWGDMKDTAPSTLDQVQQSRL